MQTRFELMVEKNRPESAGLAICEEFVTECRDCPMYGKCNTDEIPENGWVHWMKEKVEELI